MLNTETELKPFTEKTIENLLAVAGDPIDAMRLAADVYATNAYLAERALAIEAGKPSPKPPRLASRYLRSFTSDFKMRLNEIAARLKSDELSRLEAIGPAIAERLEDLESGLMGMLLLLAVMHPIDAAQWIRTHLDEIEAEYAS